MRFLVAIIFRIDAIFWNLEWRKSLSFDTINSEDLFLTWNLIFQPMEFANDLVNDYPLVYIRQ